MTNTNLLLPATPRAEPAQTWQETSSTNGSLHDVFIVEEATQSKIQQLLLESSFFLPKDVMKNRNFRVSPITCLSRMDFALFYEIVTEMRSTTIHCDTKYLLLAFAQFVGVSARKDLATGQLHIVFKLWYGNKPDTTKGTFSDYESRKLSLYTFIQAFGTN